MYIKNKRKRGQSTVEYILLVTAVIAVVIVFLSTSGGPLQTQLCSTMNMFVDQINQESDQYSLSHASSVATSVTVPINVPVTSGVDQ